MQFVNGSYQSEPDQLSRVSVNLLSPSNLNLGPAAAKTVTGVGTIIPTAENVNAVVVTVVVTAVSGTTPTLSVGIQDAATVGGSYTNRQSVAANITAIGSYTFLSTVQNLFYKPFWTIGGTTPSFTFTVFVTPFVYGSV